MALVQTGQHPLAKLHDKSLDKYRLVVLLGGKNRVSASYFRIFLRNFAGEISYNPAVIGLQNQG